MRKGSPQLVDRPVRSQTADAMLDRLRRWLVRWADSPAGPGALAILAAAESVFFPLPPDALLIALAVRNPDAALLLAGLTIAASVAGGLGGHWLGQRFGRALLLRLHSGRVDRIESMFRRHGFWTLAIAALTPLPYKVFTIGAGVFGVPRMQFVFASVLGRGIRFGSYGVLIFILGDRVEEFLNERFDLIVTALVAGLLLGAISWLAWLRWRRGRSVIRKPGLPHGS